MATREELNKEKHAKVLSEEKKLKKRKKTIFIFKAIFSVLLIITLILFYITYIANLHITVREYRIESNKLPENFNGTKIIQFSDIHYGTTIDNKELGKLVKLINSRNPDIVLFTGDLIDKNYKLNPKKQEQIIKILKKINSSIGKYAIKGEEDSEDSVTILNQSNFVLLNNNYDLIYKDNNDPILLIGLNSKLTKEININKGYKYLKEPDHNSNIYTITMLHEPDSVDEINNKYETDLFLAGHSHNGQIRLPYLGTIIRKNGSKKYYNEYYNLKNSKLYISSGIGTNGSGIRLFTHPSINLFRLSKN